MKKVCIWFSLILLGALTVFDSVLQYFSQFGYDFNRGGPEPSDLRFGWLTVVLKVVCLAASRWTGVPLLVVGMIDWIGGIAFLHSMQHQSFGAAIGNSWLAASFVLLAVGYVSATGLVVRRVPDHKSPPDPGLVS